MSTINPGATSQGGRAIFLNPWTQAILTGAVTLIPARKYPRWLRRGLVWAPPLAGTIAGGYVGVKPHLQHQLDEYLASFSASTDAETPEPTPHVDKEERSWPILRAAVAGGALGAVISCGTVAGFWLDEQLERGLNRMRVPYPRAVMALTAGVITWWQVHQEQQPH